MDFERRVIEGAHDGGTAAGGHALDHRVARQDLGRTHQLNGNCPCAWRMDN